MTDEHIKQIVNLEMVEAQEEIAQLRKENARLYAALRELIDAVPDSLLRRIDRIQEARDAARKVL